MAPKESKKEKAARKAAEEAAAAEERRLEEERVEKERIAEEERRAAEKKKRDEEEALTQGELDARVDAEVASNATYYSERSSALEKELLDALGQREWESFVACEALPDVNSEAAVNTFLTEWAEKALDGAEHLDKTLADCTQCTELLRLLQFERAHAAARGATKTAAWQAEIQLRLRDQLKRKIDGATAEFLQRSDEFVNSKNECIATVPAPGCRYALWVNLAKNPRIKSIEFPELGVSSELPKALALASIAVRLVQHDTDLCSPYASTEAAVNEKHVSLGGLLNVELLSLPAGAKKVKGWTLRHVNEMTTSVQHVQYPAPLADGSMPPASSAPPLRISYGIDASILLPEKVDTMGFWDEEGGCWRTDGISDVVFAPETRTLTFSTTKLTSLALLQPTHLELPYKGWIFCPSGPSSGDLHLQTQRYSLQIEVSSKGCTLRAPVLPELSGLIGAPMPATTLLLRLRQSGINLFPTDADAALLTRITPKEKPLEAELHGTLAPLLSRYQLAPSRWNLSRGPAKCTVRMQPTSEAFDAELAPGDESKPPPDPFTLAGDDWPTMQYEMRRVLMIKALDADGQCDDLPLEGAVAHSTPLECLKATDAELLDAVRGSSHLYQDSARQLLDSLRLFSFTAEPA